MYRYMPITERERGELLDEIGVRGIDELFEDIPQEIRERARLKHWKGLSEIEIERKIGRMGRKNKSLDELVCFRGAGAYDHHIPAAVDELIGRSEFYTSYTPYQPEISQGTLRGIFEFQTMVTDLTGMDAANASMYDGATAAAEAGIMAVADTRRGKLLISRGVHPETREVVGTYCRFREIELVEVPLDDGATSPERVKELMGEDTAGVIVQSPNFLGIVEELQEIGNVLEGDKAKFIVSTDLLSLGVLEAPGAVGADIVVGDAQSLGNKIMYGGPYLGFMSVRKKLIRKMPGRIVGESVDRNGRRSYVLTLQAREQHIRRYKATSNICSNHGLNAMAATIHMSLLGRRGLEETARQCMQKAYYTMKRLTEGEGYRLKYRKPFFREFVLEGEKDTEKVEKYLEERGILGGYPLGDDYEELKGSTLMCVTEKRSRDEIEELVKYMEEAHERV